MKKILILLVHAVCVTSAYAQPRLDPKEIMRIENVLASNDMRGRRAGTPDIDRAAGFISDEFKKAGLKPLAGNSFLQTFTMVRPKMTGIKAEIDDKEIDVSQVVVITTEKEVKVNEKSGFEMETIGAADNFAQKARALARSGKNLVVWVDTAFSKNFPRLATLKQMGFRMNNHVVFILGSYKPKSFTIKAEHTIEEVPFANVVGILPGKSRKEEYVIFSGHYDHLGVARQAENGDSIYNGANDDAAGTTAVIALADYFKKLGNNERTLVFAAFTAEEIGGFGSQYFSKQFDPAKVAAMFNIEMIGTESQWGKNSAYITGFDKTDMGAILQKNLEGTSFRFHPDPYTKENLFYRSDNATLARLGVPAHTISTAKMENEPNYHKLSDEVGTLDMQNMTAIIEAIATSARTVISGQDTPSRVKPESLNR
ncbi:MAG TPA: M20/M25/M40 family metallo-hydrolase [Flavisolibacter sp.]|nr:M20/M25/M40 family metallo-hydrolase [Flavisolibacter sp.]